MIRCTRCGLDYDTDDKTLIADDCVLVRCVPSLGYRADKIMDYAKERAIGLQLRGFILSQFKELLAAPPTVVEGTVVQVKKKRRR